MKLSLLSTSLLALHLAILGSSFTALAASTAPQTQDKTDKGPHNGRLLTQGNLSLELAIFEDGVPPEFHLYPSINGEPIPASEVEAKVTLTRLGNVKDPIEFVAQGEYLRGLQVIAEPHSFAVTVEAQYKGNAYRWDYDNFEGRVRINSDIARDSGLVTDKVAPRTMQNSLNVYGRVVLPPEAVRRIRARFNGEITQRYVSFGQRVKKGQRLLTVESNESLQSYHVYAPADGIVTQLNASSGEQTADRVLLTLTDTQKLIAELSVFPKDAAKVKPGQSVQLRFQGLPVSINTTLSAPLHQLSPEQATLFLAPIKNADGQVRPGQFVSAEIQLPPFNAHKAVRTDALQSFRDFTVVYAKVGDQYEVRMLDLGRRAEPWVEVLGGIDTGAEYVTSNSYLIKADIEKSGASHDH